MICEKKYVENDYVCDDSFFVEDENVVEIDDEFDDCSKDIWLDELSCWCVVDKSLFWRVINWRKAAAEILVKKAKFEKRFVRDDVEIKSSYYFS